jgi:hypothetical protein
MFHDAIFALIIGAKLAILKGPPTLKLRVCTPVL